ncbi:uncharacterized protein LOC125702404 isoform X2 [Lagopus muta]|uniref:uncharacterized protein LOC125702404 isoform X2 n=2 Tax=Lagopus muta TaxID=64668 RepID=UPI0020A1AD14|nr:uncharacterized protein LOC125702404 isoform X2 [Lagopus muta]XP_048821542.1 uncharacterized protein LOC125702404 isoform X2 [Lagopus muta]XP_048821543.1 uncharacterized protein LOC125702404 isoform X2 [Lagopus muta]XP_048821544.1 uncharacterized protein LOC125702404 isoform X2 [Lagopus muta]
MQVDAELLTSGDASSTGRTLSGEQPNLDLLQCFSATVCTEKGNGAGQRERFSSKQLQGFATSRGEDFRGTCCPACSACPQNRVEDTKSELHWENDCLVLLRDRRATERRALAVFVQLDKVWRQRKREWLCIHIHRERWGQCSSLAAAKHLQNRALRGQQHNNSSCSCCAQHIQHQDKSSQQVLQLWHSYEHGGAEREWLRNGAGTQGSHRCCVTTFLSSPCKLLLPSPASGAMLKLEESFSWLVEKMAQLQVLCPSLLLESSLLESRGAAGCLLCGCCGHFSQLRSLSPRWQRMCCATISSVEPLCSFSALAAVVPVSRCHKPESRAEGVSVVRCSGEIAFPAPAACLCPCDARDHGQPMKLQSSRPRMSCPTPSVCAALDS